MQKRYKEFLLTEKNGLENLETLLLVIVSVSQDISTTV